MFNYLYIFFSIGVKARRLKTDGTSDIPALTTTAEELSKLKTLKEVREKWATQKGLALPLTLTTAAVPFPVSFGLGKIKARHRLSIKKKSTRPIRIKKTSVKPIIIKKKLRRELTHHNRRSTRLALNATYKTEEEEEEEEDVAMEVSDLSDMRICYADNFL